MSFNIVISVFIDCFEKYGNGTLKTELNNVTKSFMAQYKKTMACLHNHTEAFDFHGLSPDTWSGKTRNVTCDRCQDSYRALNRVYAEVLGDIDADRICMDVVDAVSQILAYMSVYLHLRVGKKNLILAIQ